MNITITIHDEMGEQVFRADTYSVERAIEELARFERHVLATLPKEAETKIAS